MAIKRRQNWLGQQRVDSPHLKSIESAISNDFDELISGMFIGQNKSYIIRGFRINMPGSIGSSANGLQLITENSSFLHGASNESGSFYTIPEGTPAEILNSTTNERVEGAFTPNTDNYVGIEFVRSVDDQTSDQVYFWNPTTNVEITKTVPLAVILDYKIIIRTSSFESNVLPIAIVRTDDQNNVVSISDRRPLLYRLGTSGANEPNPFYQFDWSETRNENFYTSSSSALDPFYGGDKVIGSMKDFIDALMTEFKLLKGTPYWYSESSAGSIYRNRQDLGSTAMTGKGVVSHGVAFFEGQVLGMTSDVLLKGISTSVLLEGASPSLKASFQDYIVSTQLAAGTVTLEADNTGTQGNITIDAAPVVDAEATLVIEGVTLSITDNISDFYPELTVDVNGLSLLILSSLNPALPSGIVEVYVTTEGYNSTYIVEMISNGVDGSVLLSVQDIIELLQHNPPVTPGVNVIGYYGIPMSVSVVSGDPTVELQYLAEYSSSPFSGGLTYTLQTNIDYWNTNNPTNTVSIISLKDQADVDIDPNTFFYPYPITLSGGTDGSNKTIDELILDWNLNNNDEPVYLLSGDGSQVPLENIELTSAPGRINWDSDINLNFIGGKLRYVIKENAYTDHITLADNQVAYVQLVRGVDVIPNLKFTTGQKIVTSVGNVNWTEDLEPGDFIKDASKGDEFYYEIDTVDNLYQVTLKEDFQELSSGDAGFDSQYAFGVYQTSAAPSNNRHVQIADRGSVPFVEDTFWLYFRSDDEGSPQVYARMLGGKELEQGEQVEISDNTSKAIMDYMGSKNEYDNAPNYTYATGSAVTNIHLTDAENLTLGIKRLEHRDDVVPRVRVVDIVSTFLPSGPEVTIDGQVLNNDDYVFFTNPAIEGLYKVSGVGTAISFEKINAFKGQQTPVNGDLIRVETGTKYFKSIWKKSSGYWRPIEVKEATKEPTGYPNRTDSIISFDNSSRVFSIRPKTSVSNHFDIFVKGRPFRFETIQQKQISVTDNFSGIKFFFFDENGVLDYTNNFDLSLITEKVYTSTVYWDSVNQKAILLGDERHGLTMDAATHEYLHNLNGAVLTNGGSLNYSQYVMADANSGMTISLSDMTLRDEDIRVDIKNSTSPSEYFEQKLDPIAYIPIYYQEGQSGNWRKDDATQYPAKQNPISTRIQYNRIDTWAVEDVQDGYFVSMWIYATNNIEEPVIAILGQAEYPSLSEAQETDQPNILSLNGFPTQEFKLLYRCIYESSLSYTNILNAAIVDVRDLRAVEDTFFAQVAPNDHGLLSGLDDPDHGPNAVNTEGIVKDGGLSESDITVGESLDTLNKLLGQLRIKEHPTNGNRVVITGANRILNSGTVLIQEIKNLVIDFEGAEIDFVTGRIFKANGFDSLGIDFVPATIPTSEYLNYSITLIPSVVNVDNTISAQLIALPASGTSLTKEDAPKAPFAQGTKLGQVTIREDSGGIEPIKESDIMQLGTGGGGSGGTGDANELLERLKNRLANYGSYEYMTPVIFSSIEDDLEDPASTAIYSVVNSNYDFISAGDNFTSLQLLDDEFLSEEIELNEIELIHYWNLDSIDTGATYEVSRDGGINWQNVGMSRIGQSDTYQGSHTFTEELTNSFSQTKNAFNGTYTDLTDVNELFEQFTLVNTTTIKKITTGIFKTGAATGYVYAVVVKDNGMGAPSTDPLDKIGQSKFISIDGLAAGAQNVDFEIRFTEPDSVDPYHVIFKTDTIYKTEYTNSMGANKIGIENDGVDIAYTIEGLELDLRVRITSSIDEVVSEGFGVLYKNDNKITPVDGNVFRNVSTFVGDVDNLDTFTLDFLPDPRLLHVYELSTGQVYRYGAFVLDGHDVIFEPNTFNKPETVTLEFLQIQGGSFDNSDNNAALLAANHLGSTDSSIDMSMADRGILLRSADGTLYEIVIKNGGIGFDIYEVN